MEGEEICVGTTVPRLPCGSLLKFFCSIAGLLAARICHDHFESVVIVEAEGWLSTQDACPDDASNLPGKRTRLLQWEAYQSIALTLFEITDAISNDLHKPSRPGALRV